jgi:glutamate-1-semialdehyde 2,1-aminomutase
MEGVITTAAAYGLSAVALAASAAGVKARLDLSKAKHRSLAGHPRIARLVASLVPFYQHDEDRFFRTDEANDDVVAQRRADFARLTELYRERYAGTLRLTAEATELISDLQFTESYRVPFQFSRYVRRHLPVGAFLESSSGVMTTDLDGNSLYDLTGSYGVNLFGYDFYKDCIDRGIERARTGAGIGLLSSGGRRQCRAHPAPVGHGRGFVPHVRNRGCDAGG